uniref:Bet v I/Major latex protein domain-containing protein n=1 Tax=Solanum lycopersicum TaxID=4081 RepID=A0A3Q7I219_SOLLC
MGVLVDSWCFCNGGGKSERMKASIFSTKGPAMVHIAGAATGFLIHRNLLLTTHAILPSVAAAEAAEIRLQNGVAACLFPHSEAWKVYGTLQLANIVVKELPHVLHKVDVIEGDGGTGTVLKLTFPPGTPLFTYSKERFTVVDDEKKVKVALVVEGGILDHGFTFFQVRFDVIEKSETTCITKATIEYEVKEEAAANVSFVSIQTFVTIMEAVAMYLTQQKDGQ